MTSDTYKYSEGKIGMLSQNFDYLNTHYIFSF